MVWACSSMIAENRSLELNTPTTLSPFINDTAHLSSFHENFRTAGAADEDDDELAFALEAGLSRTAWIFAAFSATIFNLHAVVAFPIAALTAAGSEMAIFSAMFTTAIAASFIGNWVGIALLIALSAFEFVFPFWPLQIDKAEEHSEDLLQG